MSERLTSIADLTTPFLHGLKGPGACRLRVQLEYCLVHLSNLTMAAYNCDGPGSHDVFLGMACHYGWTPLYEGSHIMALERRGERLSLAPGGALVYASPPLATLWELECAVTQYLYDIGQVARPLGLGLLALGLHPFAAPEDVALIPQQRYHMMYDYMPRVGLMGRHMMKLACATQVNIEYHSEADALRKMQLAARLTPFFVALSANSPIREGHYAGLASARAHTWLGTDAGRTGFPDCVFHAQPSFQDYAAWALDVPMYGVEREETLLRVGHPTFRDYLDEGLLVPRQRCRIYATMADWEDHLATVFPWVRLRDSLELRVFDSNPPDIALALAALVKGLFYSPAAMDAAEAIVEDYDKPTVETLLHEAIFYGLEAEVDGVSFYDMLGYFVELAKNGLCDQGLYEYIFLKPFESQALKQLTADMALMAAVHLDRYVQSKIL